MTDFADTLNPITRRSRAKNDRKKKKPRIDSLAGPMEVECVSQTMFDLLPRRLFEWFMEEYLPLEDVFTLFVAYEKYYAGRQGPLPEMTEVERYVLETTIRRGRLDVPPWLHKKLQLAPNDMRRIETLFSAVMSGNVDMLEWTFSAACIAMPGDRAAMDVLVGAAGMHNNTGALQWMHKRFDISEIILPLEKADCLFLAAVKGNLEIFMWVHATFGLTADYIEARDFRIMRQAAHGGHVDLIRWLDETFALTYPPVMPMQFALGGVPILEWAIKKFPVTWSDPSKIDRIAIEMLFSKSPYLRSSPLARSELIEWMCTNVMAADATFIGRCVKRACLTGHFQLADRLCDTFNVTWADVKMHGPILGCWSRDDPESLAWLYNRFHFTWEDTKCARRRRRTMPERIGAWMRQTFPLHVQDEARLLDAR